MYTWDDLLKAINDKDQDRAVQIINTMTHDDFDKDYSQLTMQQSPIHLAADFGLIKIIDAVLYKCPKLANTADTYGKTPLHHAVYNGDLAVVKALIEASASVDATNTDGQTPLHYAAFHGNLAVVKALIEAGASIDATDTYGKTPLHHAAFHASSGNLSIVKALVEASASVNATDENGNTPLHEAIYHNRQEELVKLLIKAGANPDATNKNGYTILHLLLSINIPSGKRVIDIAPNETTDLIVVKLLEDASAIYKIIKSSALAKQVQIQNLDLLKSILNHNFQLHNKAYKSKAELKHIFDCIQPNSAQQQVELDKIKIQFNKIVEDGTDYANQNKVADLQYLAAVSPLVQILKIISNKAKNDDQKAQALVDVLYSQTLNIPEDLRSYVTQVFKLNAKIIKKIAQTHPKVAKDLFNIATCTDEQKEQYRAKIEEAGYDIKKGIDIANSENLKSESDIMNNADIFLLFPQCNIAELFTSNTPLERHVAANTDDTQVSISMTGQIELLMTDHHMEIPD